MESLCCGKSEHNGGFPQSTQGPQTNHWKVCGVMGPRGVVYSGVFLIINCLQMQLYYSDNTMSSEGGRLLRTNLIPEVAMRCGLFAGKEHGCDGENWDSAASLEMFCRSRVSPRPSRVSPARNQGEFYKRR